MEREQGRVGSRIRNIEDYDREEEEKQRKLLEAAEARPKVIDVAADGNYKCANLGCNKTYDPAINAEDSCHYHTGAPMFHDVKKFWTCCNAESWDWDDFQKLPTCAVGAHKPKHKK
jgi:disease resistance protein